MTPDLTLKLVYAANVLVAGWVGSLSLFLPQVASRTVFSGTAAASPAMQVTGALWLSIALLSFAGCFAPRSFAVVLVLQLIYKASWLLVVALPAVAAGNRETLPGGMTVFFLIWVIVLPFVIPWRSLLAQS